MDQAPSDETRSEPEDNLREPLAFLGRQRREVPQPVGINAPDNLTQNPTVVRLSYLTRRSICGHSVVTGDAVEITRKARPRGNIVVDSTVSIVTVKCSRLTLELLCKAS